MKHIFILLILGAVIGYFMQSKLFVLGNALHIIPIQSNKNVQGASSSALPNFAAIEKALSKLPVSDIASSSPQIQNVIHMLQKMPSTQIKMVCQNVCNGIK